MEQSPACTFVRQATPSDKILHLKLRLTCYPCEMFGPFRRGGDQAWCLSTTQVL